MEFLIFLFFGRIFDVEYELITSNVKLKSHDPYFGMLPERTHIHTHTHAFLSQGLNSNISRMDNAMELWLSPSERLTFSLL
jgi:hypothetical protein